MNNYWTHRCLIMPDSHVTLARTLCETIAGPSGSNMWNTPLSTSGNLPISHWISVGLIANEFADILPLLEYSEDGSSTLANPGKAQLAAYVANQRGMQVTVAEIQELFNVSNVTKDTADISISRLNLTMLKESSLDL